MMKARRLALEMIAPGVRCDDVDARINQFLAIEGFGDPCCTAPGMKSAFPIMPNPPVWPREATTCSRREW